MVERARPEAQPSLREHALSVIRDAIVTGELAEDRIYSAAGLAKQLGISLSPVREAMMALVTEGTVEAVPNRGFRLVPITEADLEEIIRIRVLLAVPAARELCARVSAIADAADTEPSSIGTSDTVPSIHDQLAQLREHAEATVAAVDAGDVVGFFTHDRRFHEALLAFGLGPRAAEISLRLRDQSRVGHLGHSHLGERNAGVENPGVLDDVAATSARELIDIVDLIDRGDADEVADLVTRNLYFFKRDNSPATD